MNSSVNPAGGTSFASKPSCVPMKIHSWPRAFNSLATAKSGTTWPPVPPPAITMVAIRVHSRPFAANISFRVLADTQQHSQTHQRTHQRTTAGADHGKRNSFRRPHVQHDAHIDQSLNDDGRRQTERKVTSEVILRLPGNLESAPQN